MQVFSIKWKKNQTPNQKVIALKKKKYQIQELAVMRCFGWQKDKWFQR